ncbi:MAG: hypothetical protein ACRDBO_17540 [Lachnospiraceae bacterium]
MAKSEIKQKVSIGSSSLILIFIILCLATFSLLSLSNAQGDWSLAEKNANAVKVYYQADCEGEKFVQMVGQTVDSIYAATDDEEERRQMLISGLGDYYQTDTQIAQTEIPMDFDQVLLVELLLGGEGHYSIRSWKVYNQKDYDIDTSIPVWTGE